jgi:hypothetical protein
LLIYKLLDLSLEIQVELVREDSAAIAGLALQALFALTEAITLVTANLLRNFMFASGEFDLSKLFFKISDHAVRLNLLNISGI